MLHGTPQLISQTVPLELERLLRLQYAVAVLDLAAIRLLQPKALDPSARVRHYAYRCSDARKRLREGERGGERGREREREGQREGAAPKRKSRKENPIACLTDRYNGGKKRIFVPANAK